MNKNINISHKSPDFIFILILMCIFAFGSFGVVIFGANIYASVTEQVDLNFNKVTPLSYITSKVREHDEDGRIEIIQKEGVNALVLSQVEGNTIYETWVYSYDNYLCDLFIEKGTEFKLSDGMSLIPNYGLDITLTEDKLLKLRSFDQQGKALSLNISLRSGTKNPEDVNGK